MMENRRQSNLEMLRIVSMLLIVMAHCDEIFGLASLYSRSLGINKIITDWLHIGGQIGVGCFILISGYFMVEQRVSARKLLKLAGEVWFYTISIWLVWTLWTILQGQIDADEFITATKKALFPILSSHYWFVTAYIILMALSPFFNYSFFESATVSGVLGNAIDCVCRHRRWNSVCTALYDGRTTDPRIHHVFYCRLYQKIWKSECQECVEAFRYCVYWLCTAACFILFYNLFGIEIQQQDNYGSKIFL